VTEIRTANIRRNSRKNVNAPDPMPAGPDAGFYCEEYTQAILRVKPNSMNTDYEFYVYNFENDTGNDWFEDPAERRLRSPGLDYVRVFKVGAMDRVAFRLINLPNGGNVDVFWSFS
jgi:hypothetical protein